MKNGEALCVIHKNVPQNYAKILSLFFLLRSVDKMLMSEALGYRNIGREA
jgi:hypothetical protein